MDNIFYRLIPMPGGCRGFVLEDPEGDFNVYLNQDLAPERMEKTAAHEREHIERGDTRSQLTAQALEKVLRNMKRDK